METNLVSGDLKLMNAYAALVKDEEIRTRFQTQIVDEFELTEKMIDLVFGSTFAERRPRMLRTLKMREFSLHQLHQQQIGLLADWREAVQVKDQDESEQEEPVFELIETYQRWARKQQDATSH